MTPMDTSRVPDVPPPDNSGETAFHEPILVQEIKTHLKLDQVKNVVDATLGLGGHSAAVLATNPAADVIGFDRDPGALTLAQSRLAEYGPRLRTINGNFADMATLLPPDLVGQVEAIIMDLGISSWQLASRGFSFRTEAPLDFRMNPDDARTAALLVNSLPEDELADLIYTYGEERASRRIAKAICEQRPVTTTTELASVIEGAVPRRGRNHPATKTFQALRIAVNDELGSLERGLTAAAKVLRPGGRVGVITFHSLEDRLAKRFIQSSEHLTKVNKKVIQPSRDEVLRNSRSRSAKLRVAERITDA